MKKATDASTSDDKAAAEVTFQLLVKDDLRQDTVHDFVGFTTDGNCIALLGSKAELLTMELDSKSPNQLPFPYTIASWKCATKMRPLDQLAQHVNLQKLYESSNVLEMQQLSLEPAYTAICSQDVPVPKLMAAKLSPHPLPNGQMLLGTLNSYGALILLTKTAQQPLWKEYENALNVCATLRDRLQPAYEVPPSRIKTFAHYQAYVDRSWITMFVWRPLDNSSYVLVLGTAAGSLWTLTLSADGAELVSHCELQTLLGRICLLHIRDDLLLVGDNNGLVHLYRFDADTEEGLCLVKTLWLRPDHMGLQEALITHCAERDCYYIACCKAAHLLIWCMPQKVDGSWLETRLHVGGMKITGLCALDNCNYALVTARGELYLIELGHKPVQLSASMRLINAGDTEHLQPVGLCCSPNRNLLTVLYTRGKEYLLNKAIRRNLLHVRVGRLQDTDALTKLTLCISPSVAINSFKDILIELRLDIFNSTQLEPFLSFAQFDTFAFDDLATEAQQQQLQLKYHVVDALLHTQRHERNQLLLDQLEKEMQLLLAILALTHIRLRLQFLGSLKLLTDFQSQAVQSQLAASERIMQQLEQQPQKEHQLQKEPSTNLYTKHLLAQMKVNFELLQLQLNVPAATEAKADAAEQLCHISYVQLKPSLERHYCSMCERQVLLEQQQLLELYAPDSVLLCPYCHGAYALELLDAET